MIEEEQSEDCMLYIVESDRIRSLWIKERLPSESESEEEAEEEEEVKNQKRLKLNEIIRSKVQLQQSHSTLTLISTLINSSSSSSSTTSSIHQSIQIQIKDAKLNQSNSILSVLINDHQILQIKLRPNHHLTKSNQNLKSINLIELPPSNTNTTSSSSSSSSTKSNHELIKTISSSSSSDSLIFSSSNSRCFQFQSNSNQLIEIKNNLAHHHATIQHLTMSLDSNLIISSSVEHGVMVFDQSNQSNHKLNIKSKSKITSISVSSFSFKLFTINLESKILLFDLGLHSTKPITAFKLKNLSTTQHQIQIQPILINAHFSHLNSNLIVFLNQIGQVGLGDLTHHKLISQTQLQLSKNAFIKLSEFSPNGKTLICLTTDGKLISKDLKSRKQTTLLTLSSIETSSALRLLFQSNLSSHPVTHVNKVIPRSRSKPKPSRDSPPETEALNPIEPSNHHSSPSSSSSISTLISPKLKPISSQPKSKKEFELGVKSEARVSTLVSKLDEPFSDDEQTHHDGNHRRRMVCVDSEVLERIVEGCVDRSIETHQRMMMEKFEELKLDVMRQGFRSRKELNEVFDRFLSHHFLNQNNAPSTSTSNTH